MTDTFKRITPEQAQAMREQGATFVDIRDPNSFGAGHISGSTRLDNQNLGDFIAAADLDHPLVVVCYHGHSSQGAANYLIGQGFSDVFSMDGGFELWNSQYPEHVARASDE
ncbi:thiosulfate sulfurtransferase GlpE [Pseudomonas matsuisoli]|uniref:Thiosulfate sulfurtransferase GlpE n=1 Tax=Pseudomonas matsuisoli TaxID=1515666 RepID=A0A917UZS1_9PSED|nr:thiosulfate sulfurtransferase GlpE [Pseudomonas matsuisoli]GGK02140.1 thiosulfate sulfurtransferase GlpE [Pseudomonas matsuisoli]